MKKLVLEMMAICAGALIVSCGSGKNMLSVSSLDGEWNITCLLYTSPSPRD